jgi:hypothetical protein
MTRASRRAMGSRLWGRLCRGLVQRSWRHRGRRFGRRFRATPTAPRRAAAARPVNRLEAYFDANREGPGIWKWRHYFATYDRHFSKFVGREVHVVEIGVFSGGSLKMWLSYFGPGCRVYGVDLDEACKVYETEAIRVFIGDQGSGEFWARFRDAVPILDIVIDDGGHKTAQQVATLEALLPHLREGGVYLCEDITGIPNYFQDYIDGLSVNLNLSGRASPSSDPEVVTATATSTFQRSIGSVHRYPYVTVIERAEREVKALESVRRGTEWRPFRADPTAIRHSAVPDEY